MKDGFQWQSPGVAISDRKRICDAIFDRISRRSYDGVPLTNEEQEKLQPHLDSASSASSLRFSVLIDGGRAFDSMRKTYGTFHGVRSLVVIVGDVADEQRWEKAGYFGERIILEATHLGLGTCWIGGTYDKNDPMFAVGEGEELLLVITIGQVRKQPTLKEKILRGLTHRKSKSLEEMCRGERPLSETEREAMRAVQHAPSAMNKQKVLFVVRESEICAGVPDDYIFDRVDLGIAKLHYEAVAGGYFEWGNGGRWIAENT